MNLKAYEWHGFDDRLPGVARGTGAPLHIGPSRWLLIAPQEGWLEVLRSAELAGRGVLTEVTGRWVAVEFPAPATATPHPLCAALPLDLVLRDREAAMAWVFDCPIVLVRRNAQVGVLVEASYEHSFREALATL